MNWNDKAGAPLLPVAAAGCERWVGSPGGRKRSERRVVVGVPLGGRRTGNTGRGVGAGGAGARAGFWFTPG